MTERMTHEESLIEKIVVIHLTKLSFKYKAAIQTLATQDDSI